MAKFDNQVVNENVPRMGNALSRWLSECVLNIMGWKISGSLPQEKKLIFIGAPHTSNWDFILALAAMQSVGLKCSWMMKKQAFFWPLGRVFKKLGGVPIDRGAADDVIPQISNWLKSQDKAYLGLTPEGTRSKVDVYKRGYLRIANAAHVPVFLVGVDAIHKRVVLDKIWPLTGDIDVDNRNIKAYYDANFKGIRAHLA